MNHVIVELGFLTRGAKALCTQVRVYVAKALARWSAYKLCTQVLRTKVLRTKVLRCVCVAFVTLTRGTKASKGMASIEVLPIIMMFVVLVAFGLGFFGVVHTGIVHSIHARTYAFESLRNRAHYNHMRDTRAGEEPQRPLDDGPSVRPQTWIFYQSFGYRTHGISSLEAEKSGKQQIHPTLRDIKFPKGSLERAPLNDVERVHNTEVPTIAHRATDKQQVNPVWLMLQYGICLNAQCRGSALPPN